MNADEYQRQAARTLISNGAVPAFPKDQIAAAAMALDLLATLGCNVIDPLKKSVFHEHGLDWPAIMAELRTVGATATHAGHLQLSTFQVQHGVDPARTQAIRLLWNGMGLGGEVGEVLRPVVDHVVMGAPLDRAALIKELGDLCWYMAAICSVLDIPLSEVLETNLAKLRTRYPDGWDAARSVHTDGESEADPMPAAVARAQGVE